LLSLLQLQSSRLTYLYFLKNFVVFVATSFLSTTFVFYKCLSILQLLMIFSHESTTSFCTPTTLFCPFSYFIISSFICFCNYVLFALLLFVFIIYNFVLNFSFVQMFHIFLSFLKRPTCNFTFLLCWNFVNF
jgi:hypothetical protein